MARLYVGNLPYQVSEADLENWFSQAGVAVDSVHVVRDRFSGEPRGFAFVEIGDDAEARRAISGCNGKELLGRALVVNEARPLRDDRGGGRGGPRKGSGGGPGGRRGGRSW